MNKNNIVVKKINLSQLEIKQYFEMLNKYINSNGVGAELTYAAIKTIKSLESVYQEIQKAIYNPDQDPKVAEYKQEVGTLIQKFADRDEQGNIKFDANKNPIITEQIVEYQNAVAEVNKKFEETLTKVNGAGEYNQKVLANTRDVEIYTFSTITLVPEEIPGVFMYYMFREEF